MVFQKIILVIPTYNEAENLSRLVSVLLSLPLEGLSLLVVDDHSPDGTGQVAERLALEYPSKISILHRPGKQGLGTAYLEGFRLAFTSGADVIGQMDADFSHPPEKLVELVQALDCCDVAMGSRYVSGGGVDQRWPIWRKGLSRFGNFYARTLLRLPVRDVTGGFRVWKRVSLESLPLECVRSNGYAFLVELTYLATKLGLSIREVPIYFTDRLWGVSKMSFKIQRESAIRVWQMMVEYRGLKRKG